jgi:hypothetical protein
LNASRLSQQEVFKHEVAFATDKWLTANTAGHFLEDGLRSCLDFDNVIKRFAIRARKGIEGRRSAASHVTPHIWYQAEIDRMAAGSAIDWSRSRMARQHQMLGLPAQ